MNLHSKETNNLSIKKKQLSQSLYLSRDQSTLDAHDIECILNFRFYFNCIEALFYKVLIKNYGVYAAKKETRKENSVHF